MKDIQNIVRNLPVTSGVYLMKDKTGRIIYIGKAVSLRKRVQSYFRDRARGLKDKTAFLVARVADIDYIETDSEAEALILEAGLVKKHQPKYNIDLRDDKSYPFIEINDEEFPRVSFVRPRVKNKTSTYFGPYVNAKLIREALNIIRRIFPFRVCHPFPDKECLDFHMKLCDAPCIGNISRRDYLKNIRRVSLILDGKKDALYRNLRRDMERLARARQYEQAAKVRDQLQAIGALYSGNQDMNYFKEAEQLQRALKLPSTITRIEAFDISNTFGKQSVGAMVSFLNGKPDKNNYRRFKIKEVQGIDDFSMIAEVVRRRYSRLKKEGALFPDLIMIDGGKGQLSSAFQELEKLEVNVPVISLAKREEEIFVPGKRGPLRLAKDSLGLKLLQRVRDEVHRFAIAYHRKLRARKVFE